jgi:hypothetical protein
LGRATPTRVVLVLNSAQASRPTTAALRAAQLATRFSKGDTLTVVCGADLDAQLSDMFKQVDVVRVESTQAWCAAQGAATDLMVVPGGRNGALSTAKLTKTASGVGATVVAVADQQAVAAPAPAITSPY